MKRPILIFAIGFIIGIIWGLYFNIALFVLVIILLFILYKCLKKVHFISLILSLLLKRIILIVFFTSFFIGNVYIVLLENNYNKIYSSFDKVNVIGTIISQKNVKEYRTIYTIKVLSINNKKVNKKFFLSVKNENASFNFGDKIYIEGEYVKPSQSRNYNGFDYSRYLKSLNIYGTIKQSGGAKLLEQDNVNILSKYANTVQTKIINNVNSVFPKETRWLIFRYIIRIYQFNNR